LSDPYKNTTSSEKDLNKLLFSSLIKNLKNEKFELGIAESVGVSSDKQTYKVVLRDNIYFSNGDEIKAEDVLYSLNQIPLEKNYTAVAESEKVIVFNVKNSLTSFLDTLTYPIVQKNQKFENNFSKNLVTSSFFKISDIEKDVDGNVTKIFLSRFNNGEAKLPFLKNYNLIFFRDEVLAYSAFQRKEIDLLSGIPGTTISKIKDDTNIVIEKYPLSNNFALFLNQNKNEFLRNAALREALSETIDRVSLTNQVLGSFGLPMKNLLGNSGKLKTNEEIIDSLEASFIFENGVLYGRTKETSDTKGSEKAIKQAVKIKLTTIENKELTETAKFLQNSFKKIGVEVEILIIDRKDLNNTVKERDFESLLFGFSVKDEKDYESFFSSKERIYPKLNISNYASKETDRILGTLSKESDSQKIQNLIENLSAQIQKDNPIILLYKPQLVFAHFQRYQIILPNSLKSESDRYGMIQNWYTDTEKISKIFINLSFLNKLVDKMDMILY
jgi:peptide/nickel transport system substrate-binding protein